MAQVPTLSGPNVSASAQPMPTQQLNAPASAFGASVVGEGAQEVGAAAGHTSDELASYAQQFQAINNKQAADTASVNAVQALDKLRVNYQANNAGMAAYENLPDFYKQVEDTRASFGENLSPMAKDEFESASRRYVANVQSDVTGFAVGQRKAAVVGSSNAVIQTAQADGAANFDNPDRLDASIAQIAHEVAFQSQPSQLGLTPEQAQSRLHSEVGAIFQSGIKQAIDSGDYLKAQGIYATHKEDMTLPQIDQIAGALKVGATAYVSRGFAEDIANGIAPKDTSGLVSPGLHAANNNPTNLQPLPGGKQWEGQTGTNGRFATFATPEAGVNAAVKNLESYGSQHGIDTLAGIAARWAPVGDGSNDPTAYAAALGKSLGISPTAHIDMTDQAMLHKIVQAQIPLEGAGGSSAAPTVPPPPKITASMDPEQVRADYDTYITQTAHTLYGNNPTLEQSSIQAARARISVNIQQVQANQTASYNRLFAAIEGGQSGNDPRPLDLASLSSSYPGASNDLSSMPPRMQASIGENLNRANSPYGSFVTPHMTQQAETLTGMSITQPQAFAQADLSKYDLSASDRKSFIKLQATTQNKEAQSAKLNTYLANPVVASVVKTNFPQKDGDQYNAFIGALQGQVDALQLKEGKPPTQQEISSVAQTLVTSKGGFLGFGASKPVDVPDEAKTAITSKYQQLYHRDPYPNELSYAYQRGPQYYGR